MKVLNLPDEQDNPIRKMLLKQDNNTLEELAKKSKEEIQTFIVNINLNQENDIKKTENQQNEVNNEFKKSLLNNQKEYTENIITKNIQETTFIDKKNDEKFLKLKSLLPPSTLTTNSELIENFKSLD
ncbi:MAG: hypothetical protein PHH41_11075 [Sulfurimonas sp.]|nr:hypothetical protein [Sulfurimonas sp.]